MKALSIRQPWAWAILHAGKRIENRSRKDGKMPPMCSHRGPLLLHASAGCSRAEYEDAISLMIRTRPGFDRIQSPTWREAERGGIVGVCNVLSHITPDGFLVGFAGHCDAVKGVDKGWHVPGSWGFVLADVRPLPFVPFKGSLGLFEVPDALLPPPSRTP